MSTPNTKPPQVTQVTLSREITISQNFQSAKVGASMSVDVNSGSIDQAKLLLRTELDKFLIPRVKEAREYIVAATKEG